LLTHCLDWRLGALYQGLQTALAPFALRPHDLGQGAVWLRDIAAILSPQEFRLSVRLKRWAGYRGIWAR